MDPTAAKLGDILVTAGTRGDPVAAGGGVAAIRAVPRSINAPPASFQRGVLPQITAAGDTAYLVWGETGEPVDLLPDGRPVLPLRVKRIWQSTRIGDAEWTTPLMIDESAIGIPWGLPNVAFGRSERGDVHLVIMHSPVADESIVHVQFKGATPVLTRQAFPGGLYARAAFHKRGGVLAFIAADRTALEDRNSVFVSRWSSVSSSWSEPQLVQRSGNADAAGTQIAASRDGTFHLIWSQAAKGARTSSALRHVESRDGGASWSKPADLAVSGANPGLLVAIGERAVGLVFTAWDSVPPTIKIACWENGWRAPVALAPGLHLRTPSLIGLTDDEAIVAVLRGGEATATANIVLRQP